MCSIYKEETFVNCTGNWPLAGANIQFGVKAGYCTVVCNLIVLVTSHTPDKVLGLCTLNSTDIISMFEAYFRV